LAAIVKYLWPRRHEVSSIATALHRDLDRRDAFGRILIDAFLTIFREKGVEENDGADAAFEMLQRAADRPSAIGMADERHIPEVFVFEDIHDVLNMCFQRDGVAHEMRAFAKPCQGRREDLVSFGAQQISHPPPATAAMPGAMNEHEGLWLGGLSEGRRSPCA